MLHVPRMLRASPVCRSAAARSALGAAHTPLKPRLRRSSWLCALALAACSPAFPPHTPSAEPPAASESAPASPRPAEDAAPAGTAATAPAPADPSAPASAGAEAAQSSADPSADDNLDADIAELSRSTQSGAEPKQSETKGRDVVYRVTPKGLVIEVNGIHFRPEAKAVRGKHGSYEILLTLNAESFDERQYWVRQPDDGPLAIAGSIEGKSGKSERFSDQRQGDGHEEVVMSGGPRSFKQRWPGRGQPRLQPGQTVTLEVGLWGVRAESERERPVRRLFMVKMVASGRGQPVITPPTLDWGG